MLKTQSLQFKAEVYEFTKDNISKFVTPVYGRTINKSHVKKLKDFLISYGFQFGSAITCVKTGSGKFLVLDGNHRVEAFRELLLSGRTSSIFSVLIEYPTMSLESQKDLMTTFNIVVKRHNCESLFEVYEKEIYIYQHADELNHIKVTIRQKKGFFRLINLINFLEVKDSKKMPMQHSLQRTVERAIESNKKDMDFLKEFLNFFEEVYGKISFENRYAVSCFMIPLASIFGVNYEKIIKDIKNSKFRFQNLIQDPEIIDLLRIGGKSRQLLHAVRERQIKILNRKLLKKEELFE